MRTVICVLGLLVLMACSSPEPAPAPTPTPRPVAQVRPRPQPQPVTPAATTTPKASPRPAPSPKKKPAPPLPPMQLRGTLVTRNRGIASIEVEGEGGVRTVPQGRELFGYVLTDVHPDRVVFRPREGEGKVVLYLDLASETSAVLPPPPVPLPEPPAPPEPAPPTPDVPPAESDDARLTITRAEDGANAVRLEFSGQSPFAEAGFQSGDLVLSIRGEPVVGESQVQALVAGPSAPALVVVERNGQRENLTVNRSHLYEAQP